MSPLSPSSSKRKRDINEVEVWQNHEFKDENGIEYQEYEFGNFGAYMRNKQIKLQNEHVEMRRMSGGDKSQIFHGCAIYVNGYTKPGMQEIRRMVVENGGIFLLQLRGKTSATHIIASVLTPKKMIEFASYKVVRPDWITDSISKVEIQPWRNYSVILPSEGQKSLNFRVGSGKTAEPKNGGKMIQPTSEEFNRRLLQDPNVLKHSVLDPEFLDSFYKNSRLHHLSNWKGEIKAKLEEYSNSALKQMDTKKLVKGRKRIILHIDFDSFFVSVALLNHPELKDKCLCVSHGDGAGRSAEIASCNYNARKFGVRNGMWIGQARKLCPELISLPYEFEQYEKISKIMYRITIEIGKPDLIEPVSVDELLIEVTSTISDTHQAEKLAQEIRSKVFAETGCQVSIGIGSNILLTRLALKQAKPAGQYTLMEGQDGLLETLGNFDVLDLPGIGGSIADRMKMDLEVESVADLQHISKSRLISLFGNKIGGRIYNQARGIDSKELEPINERKSVSAEVNYGVRFYEKSQIDVFLVSLSEELVLRLKKLNVGGSQLTAKIYRRAAGVPFATAKFMGAGEADSFSKSVNLKSCTVDAAIITREAQRLIHSFNCPVGDYRGIALQMTRLGPVSRGVLQGLYFPVSKDNPSNEVEPSKVQHIEEKSEPIVIPKAENDISDVSDSDLVSELGKSFHYSDEEETVNSAPCDNPLGNEEEKNSNDLVELDDDVSFSSSLPFELLQEEDQKIDQIRKWTGNDSNEAFNDTGRLLSPSPKQEDPNCASSNFPSTLYQVPSQMDMTVVDELPEKIRSQIVKTYKEVSKKNDSGKENIPGLVKVDLPSQNQMDQQVFEALPLTIQAEITSAYTEQERSRSASTSKEPTTPRKVAAGMNKREKTLSPSPRKQHELSIKDYFGRRNEMSNGEYCLGKIDWGILRELPSDVVKQVLADIRMSSSNNPLERSPTKSRSGSVHETKKKVIPGPRKLEYPIPRLVGFEGLYKLQDVRHLLATWVKEGWALGADKQDVDDLIIYLSGLVLQEKDIDKACNISRWFTTLVQDKITSIIDDEKQQFDMSWIEACDKVRNAVSKAAHQRGFQTLALE